MLPGGPINLGEGKNAREHVEWKLSVFREQVKVKLLAWGWEVGDSCIES
jgi:hypothetical protein